MKRKLKNIINELSLNIYKKVSPNGFPSGWDVASDIQRIINKKESQIIFDVGANIGEMSLYLNKRFPDSQIFSFEPIKETFENLEKRTNHLQNISCFHNALGDTQKSLTISLNDNSEKNSLIQDLNNVDKEKRTSELIEIQTLDSFCAEKKIEQIDLLKTDTEGFDFEVLKGSENLLNQKKIMFILSEVGFIKSDIRHTFFPSVYEYLYTKGFRFYALYDLSYWFPYRYEGLIYANALFINHKAIKNQLSS